MASCRGHPRPWLHQRDRGRGSLPTPWATPPAPDWIWAELHPKERLRTPYLAAARAKKKKPAPAKKQQHKATKAPREKKENAAEAAAARVVAPPASSHICSARRRRHRLQERHAVPKLEGHRCGGQWLSDCHHAGPTPGPGLGFGGRAHWRLQWWTRTTHREDLILCCLCTPPVLRGTQRRRAFWPRSPAVTSAGRGPRHHRGLARHAHDRPTVPTPFSDVHGARPSVLCFRALPMPSLYMPSTRLFGGASNSVTTDNGRHGMVIKYPCSESNIYACLTEIAESSY